MESQKKTNKRPRAQRSSSDSDSDYEDACDPTRPWPRFLIIKSLDQSKPATRLHPFLVGKTLEGRVGSPKASRLADETLLVEVGKRAHAISLLGLQAIGETKVQVKADPRRNSCKGVIRDEGLCALEEEEIVQCLKKDNVIAAKRTFRKGTKEPLPTIILTFGVPSRPHDIWGGFCRILVKPFVPSPLRCFKCQKFGHGQTGSKCLVHCAVCGEEGHDDRDCSKPKRCRNCGEGHSSSSKDCEVWKQQCALKKYIVEEQVSFREACQALNLTPRGFPKTQIGITYAGVVGDSGVAAKPGTCKCCTCHLKKQTDADPTLNRAGAAPVGSEIEKVSKETNAPAADSQQETGKEESVQLPPVSNPVRREARSSAQGAGPGAQPLRQGPPPGRKSGANLPNQGAGRETPPVHKGTPQGRKSAANSPEKNSGGDTPLVQKPKIAAKPQRLIRVQNEEGFISPSQKKTARPNGPSFKPQKGDLSLSNKYDPLDNSNSMEVEQPPPNSAKS